MKTHFNVFCPDIMCISCSFLIAFENKCILKSNVKINESCLKTNRVKMDVSHIKESHVEMNYSFGGGKSRDHDHVNHVNKKNSHENG